VKEIALARPHFHLPFSSAILASHCLTAPLTYQWQKNGANISRANSASYITPAVVASDNGSIFRCVVSNVSGSATSQSVTLTVTSPPTNQAPRVNAGPDQTITLSAGGQLQGSVTDDGLPKPPGSLTIDWNKTKGRGTVTFANPSSPTTTATFSRTGTYVLRLRASDGSLCASDRVTIIVK